VLKDDYGLCYQPSAGTSWATLRNASGQSFPRGLALPDNVQR
jgi:hypothetical protein